MAQRSPERAGAGRAVFRPRFTLIVLYLVGFTVVFALGFALPDLLAAARSLPPGDAKLSPEELEHARELTRQALAGGRVWLAFLAAALATGFGAFTRRLPGMR